MSKTKKFKKNKQAVQPLFRPRRKVRENYFSGLAARYSIGIVLLGFFILLFGGLTVMAIQSRGVKLTQETSNSKVEARQGIQALFDKNMDLWNLRYNRGYRLIILEPSRVILSQYNSLPKEMRIGWQEISFVPLNTKEEHDQPGTVKISFPQVTYPPANIFSRTILVGLLPQAGERFVLFTAGEEELVFDIVEVYEKKIIGILGLH